MEGKEMVLGLIDAMREKIESQAREIERLTKGLDYYKENLDAAYEDRQQLRTELAALKSQPGGVVLPERMATFIDDDPGRVAFSRTWNACLDEVARLNQPASGGDDATVKQSLAVGDDAERAAFEAAYEAKATELGIVNFDRVVFVKGADGLYVISSVQTAWWAWQARAALPVREAVAEGWKLVPVDSTGAMEDAAGIGMEKAREVYRAMLAAAPSPSREGE